MLKDGMTCLALCDVFLQNSLLIYIFFPFPICKFPPLTYPSWCFPLKTAYFTAFCRQGSGHFDLFIPPCSITPCQPLRLMSKVMTGLLLQRLRHSRGLVRVAKVVIIVVTCLQGKNENFPKEAVRGPEEEEKDKPTPHLGWGIYHSSWYWSALI